ncbi:MAG: pyroglutamyl-peptidase I [Candidatus Heimdallarchaeota archaeon]|nr:pyroglutamyl-peptidase I [Candidatus Heimdallarchaeota archaeon]
MTILLTGYEAFGDWEINPTEVAALALDGLEYHGHTIVARVLPLRYEEIKPTLVKLVKKYSPDAVILTGQAGGDAIRLERIAKNLVDCKLPYNCGTIINDSPLSEEGESTLSSTLPLELIFMALTNVNIKVEYSDDAGAFGCNQVFYQGRETFADIPMGFIHVPLLPEQTKQGNPSMDQNTITDAIRVIAATVAKWIQDKS